MGNDQPLYLTGNTGDLATEWEAGFVVSRGDDHSKIPAAEMDEFWDRLLDLVEEFGYALGGGYKPITDADYEVINKPEPPICVCSSHPFEPEGEHKMSSLCPVHGIL